MWTKAAAALLAGGLGTWAMLWVLVALAPRLGLLDDPGGRKAHCSPTPLVGGLAIAAGSVLGLLGLATADPTVREALGGLVAYKGLLIGLAGMLAMGVIDDRRPIPARYKMLIQVGLCCLAIYLDRLLIGNIGITIGPVALSLGNLLAPFTLLVMLTIINALNMIDGVDGLASGITCCALAIIAKAAFAGMHWTDAWLLCGLLGGLLAFMTVNFPIWPGRRAWTFLGDGGTLMLGFLVAYFAIRMSAVPQRVFRPSTVIWFFFIPVADAVLLYLRRTLRDRAPARPGRDHIHHILLDRFPPWLTTWILVGTSAIMAGGAYFAERTGARPIQLVLGWIFAFIAFAIVTQRPWDAAWRKSHAGSPAALGTEQGGTQDAP